MSREAKIGLVLVAAVVVGVALFAMTRRTHEPAPPPPAAERADSGRSEKVQQRLDQLQGGQDDPSRREYMRDMQARDLPTAAPGQMAPPRAAAPPAAVKAPPGQEDVDKEDLDFDTLKKTALNDSDPENRIVAIWLLASLDDQPVIPVLTQALSDSDPEVRLAAIESLSDFSDDAPIDALQLAMDDPDPEVRFEAISIAADMEDERVKPLLEKALNDPDEDVRSLAQGIKDLGDTPAHESGEGMNDE